MSATVETATPATTSVVVPDANGYPAREFHPAANIFPLMEGADFDALVKDIFKNGLLERIWTFEGKILDGRNRYLACVKAGVAPEFREWEYLCPADDPIAFVIAANLRRRHLNPSQLALIAEKIATLRAGQNKMAPAQHCAASQGEAAKAVGVSRRQVQKAREVVKKATPEDVKAIETGKKTINEVVKALPKKIGKLESNHGFAMRKPHPVEERAENCIFSMKANVEFLGEILAKDIPNKLRRSVEKRLTRVRHTIMYIVKKSESRPKQDDTPAGATPS